MITILGYGSLLSEASARRTCPNLTGFRLGRVQGYRRMFDKVGIVFIQKGLANWDTLEVSSLTVEPDPGTGITVSVFEIPDSEMPALQEREHRYFFERVRFQLAGGAEGDGMICRAHSHDAYEELCGPDEFQRRVGQWYDGPLRRRDILPCRSYLAHCLRAARDHGDDILDNFLDTSFLADGTTPIRTYVDEHPEVWEATSEFDRYRS